MSEETTPTTAEEREEGRISAQDCVDDEGTGYCDCLFITRLIADVARLERELATETEAAKRAEGWAKIMEAQRDGLRRELGAAREALQDLDTLMDFSEPVVPLGQMPQNTRAIDAAFTRAHKVLKPDCAGACCTLAVDSQDDMDREMHGG